MPELPEVEVVKGVISKTQNLTIKAVKLMMEDWGTKSTEIK